MKFVYKMLSILINYSMTEERWSLDKRRRDIKVTLSVFVLCIAFLLVLVGVAQAASPADGQGYVDRVDIQNGGQIVSLSGWAGVTRANTVPVEISVLFGEKTVYKGRFERLERPDVVRATDRPDWLSSGWQVAFNIPDDLPPGKYLVSVFARTTTGDIYKLKNGSGTDYVEIPERWVSFRKIVVTILLGVAMISGAVLYWRRLISSLIERRLKRDIPVWVIPASLTAIAFFILVSLGVTGSSLGLALEASPATVNRIETIFAKNRPIRSDEWAVFTPMAIGQYNHSPRFPVVNKNLGPDGQNMLIVGMTGEPVSHLSAVAKPATWGFFVFDLPRSLAWYWWFPIFGCFFALWSAFVSVFRGKHQIAVALSAAFVLSPYVTAWSYWPAYTTLFPAAGLTAILIILRTSSRWHGWLAATLLGLSMAGFVLILYPAWQIPLGYLFVLILLAVVIRDKLYKSFSKLRLFYLIFALSIAGIICFQWWIDSKEAINLISSTVYPGQRAAVMGGDIEPWYWVKGISNIATMYGELGGYSNQSEIASFLYLWIPVFISVMMAIFRKKRIDYIALFIAAFVLLVSYYQFFGFSSNIALYTLWGRSSSARADIALGLAQLFLIGSVFYSATPNRTKEAQTVWFSVITITSIILWGLVQFLSYKVLPKPILESLSPGVVTAGIFASAVASYLLIRNHFRSFFALYLIWSISIIVYFNPLSLAPSAVPARIIHSGESNEDQAGRVLVMNSQIPAMALLASGIPVYNGIHYYPQFSIWKVLDPNGTNRELYNRYQHLIFVAGKPGGDTYRIELPQPDLVKVVLDIERFDFTKLGIQTIVGPSDTLVNARNNPVLEHVTDLDGWSVYHVINGDQQSSR